MNAKAIKLIAAIFFAAIAFTFYIKLDEAKAKENLPVRVEVIDVNTAKLYKIIDGEYTCYLFGGLNKAAMQCVPTRY